jgi:uncharacterized protein (TIGR03435 family)
MLIGFPLAAGFFKARKLARLNVFVLFACGLFGQNPDERFSFEVASIRPTSGVLPGGRIVVGMLAPTGGPGTSDPGRIHFPAISLKRLLLKAYDVDDTMLKGPGWLDDEFFELNALMPLDTTKEELQLMLLNLLEERFKLKVHHEPKSRAGYTLVVSKQGPKMTESTGTMPPRDQNWTARRGNDGFIIPRPGQHAFEQNGPLRCRWTYQHASMALLAVGLKILLGSPVTDGTGLLKEYDFSITFRTTGTTLENGPMNGVSWEARSSELSKADDVRDLFGAVEALGLKLEPKKASEETIVIDHIEKQPTEN